jgi:hypothetical protein
MIMKLKAEARPKGAVEPVKKKTRVLPTVYRFKKVEKRSKAKGL